MRTVLSPGENCGGTFAGVASPAYKTLVQYLRAPERILASRIAAVLTRDGEDVSDHPRQSLRRRDIDQRGNLVSQLILGYCCRVSFILNVFLVFDTEVKRFHINGNFLNCSGKLIVP